MGLGTAFETIKDTTKTVLDGIDKDDLKGIATRVGKSAVKGAAYGGAAGAVGNAVQGKNVWDGVGSGAKKGAIVGAGIGLYKEGTTAYDAGVRSKPAERSFNGNRELSRMQNDLSPESMLEGIKSPSYGSASASSYSNKDTGYHYGDRGFEQPSQTMNTNSFEKGESFVPKEFEKRSVSAQEMKIFNNDGFQSSSYIEDISAFGGVTAKKQTPARAAVSNNGAASAQRGISKPVETLRRTQSAANLVSAQVLNRQR